MKMRSSLAGALALIAILAGCTNEGNEGSTTISVLSTLRENITSNIGPKPPAPPLTRDLINQVRGPVMEVRRERTPESLPSFLAPTARRQDDNPGEVLVWSDNVSGTVAFREGLLIGTRGLGGDVLSSDVTSSIAAVANRGGSGQRVHFIRADDNSQRRVAFACSVSALGSQTLNIVGLQVQTEKLQETCEAPSGRIVNDYWIESRSGTMWQSRQWAGPYIGYLNIRRLK